MKRLIEYKINKYATYVSNLTYNIEANNLTGERLEKAEVQLSCYKEILSDLRELIKKH